MQALLENEGVEIKNNQIIDLKKYLREPKNALQFLHLKLQHYQIFTLLHYHISCIFAYLNFTMKLTKQQIEQALSYITLPNKEQNIVESGAIKNIQIFGKDVELDVEIQNPTL